MTTSTSQKSDKNVPGTGLVKTNEQNLPAKQEPSAKAEQLHVVPKEKTGMSVEDMIRKVLIQSEHITTRRKLYNHLEMVDALKFNDFDDKNVLILKDSKGSTYEIKSPGLCQKIADLAKYEICAKIEEVDELIMQ